MPLMGYYFMDKHFRKPVLITPTNTKGFKVKKIDIKHLLSLEKQNFLSIRWIGYIQPPNDGDYIFSTPSDLEIIMQIDGKTIINQNKMKLPVQLEKDKVYQVRIEYRPESLNSSAVETDFHLYWSTSNTNEKEIVPEENLLLPDFSRRSKKDKTDQLIPQNNLFNSKLTDDDDPSLDSDDDGIYDDWEINGYTNQGLTVVSWDDSLAAKGFKKYVSDPYDAHTAADPYTDFEKVVGTIDKAVSPEGRNPLVPAYPIITVGMEELIVSNVQDVTQGTAKTISKSTSSSKTSQNTLGIDIQESMKISLFPEFNVSITEHYSHTWSDTTTVEDSSSESWDKQIGINTGQAAYINANVRYDNVGNAPVYNVQPTTDFVIDGDTVQTVRVQENDIANVLIPGETYPAKGHSPLAINTFDQFNSHYIYIDYDHLIKLQNSKQMKLDTTQVNGQYGIINMSGNLVMGGEWDPVKKQIEVSTASLILDTGKEVLERRIAARNSYEYNIQTKPEITLGEAVKIAFANNEQDGQPYYNDILLDEYAVQFVFDEDTIKDIQAQFNQMEEKNLYNVKLKARMNIYIKSALFFDDFDKHTHSWYYTYTVPGGITGNCGKAETDSLHWPDKIQLKPNTTYALSMYVKVDSGENSNAYIFATKLLDKWNKKGFNKQFPIGSDWRKIQIIFNTGDYPENYSQIGVPPHAHQLKNLDYPQV